LSGTTVVLDPDSEFLLEKTDQFEHTGGIEDSVFRNRCPADPAFVSNRKFSTIYAFTFPDSCHPSPHSVPYPGKS
jgi:hypothetical protein